MSEEKKNIKEMTFREAMDELNKTVELGLVCDNITNRLNVSNGSVDGTTSYYLVDAPFTFMATAKFHF